MRLFAAVWPPDEVIDDVAREVSRAARGEPRGLRWSTPGQFHLTLAFLGEVPDARRPELERRLARVAERYPPLGLRLAGAGRFGDRVLYLRVEGDREPLRRLADSTAAAARRAGVDVEDRTFRPHLTLARVAAGGDLRPLVSVFQPYRGADWTATELRLVASRLGAGPAGRAVYETVARWPLAAPKTP